MVADEQPPADVEEAAILTDYAVSTRYPGDMEPVEEDEYCAAIRLAEATLSWATAIILKAAQTDAPARDK